MDVYPGSHILIFTHPGSRIQKQQQKRGVKKICCHTIFGSHKFHKIEIYFIFEMLKKIIWAYFQRIMEQKPLKNMGLGSGIPDPQHWVRNPWKNVPIPGWHPRCCWLWSLGTSPTAGPSARSPDPGPQLSRWSWSWEGGSSGTPPPSGSRAGSVGTLHVCAARVQKSFKQLKNNVLTASSEF